MTETRIINLGMALLVAIAFSACGPSEEEKAKKQAEAEAKVNEILDKLENTDETPEPAAKMDSTVADTADQEAMP